MQWWVHQSSILNLTARRSPFAASASTIPQDASVRMLTVRSMGHVGSLELVSDFASQQNQHGTREGRCIAARIIFLRWSECRTGFEAC